MPIQKLEHYTIRCESLDRTRDFYCDVLGLRVGQRPPLPFDGYWLYVGDCPAVHLVAKSAPRPEAGYLEPDGELGALDHVAFLSSDYDAMRSALEVRGIAFQDLHFPGVMRQLFVADPDNIVVELTFREAPAL